MAKNHSTQLRLPKSSALLTEADGRDLAIQMLRDIEGLEGQCFIEAQARKNPLKPQVNVALAYFDLVRKKRNRALEVGFTSIVTEYLCSGLEGCVPGELDFYEEIENGSNRCADPSSDALG